MAKLFGFSIDDNDKLASSAVSPVPQNNEDGVDHYLTSGFFGAYVDIEGVYRTEFDMIKRYREMALHPEVDSAIEDIVNEAIVSDTNDSPIKIELSNLNASDGIKEKIREEFKYILEMLDFDKKSHEIYRNWYVDGRLYYHKVIDFKNPKDGIQELRYIDAMKMRYVRKQKKKKGEPNNAQILRVTDNPMDFDFPDIEEYFLFDPKASYPVGAMGGQNLGAGGTKGAVPIARDAVTYCTSGLVDRNKGITLSYLHKAIKSLNQLRMIEDSLVIYRLCLVGDTRVKTDKGYSYIKDINVGDTVYAYDNNVDGLVETKVTNKWLTGIKPTFKVKSKHHSIIGTDTHPVLVYDAATKEVKYIPIKDLEPRRHFVTYIKPKDTDQISDMISFSFEDVYKNGIPSWMFNHTLKEGFLDAFLYNYGSYEDTLDGFSYKIVGNKKLIEGLKELCNSLGVASSHIEKVSESYELRVGSYELPKFEKIESVEPAETEEVYDIEVEHEKHNFVANGIIVHNSRAPERRIFYIDVGNLPKVKAEQYLRDVMMRYRNKLTYNACLAMDTQIPLLDGRTLTLEQITEEFNKGERLWAYSCDPNTGKFAPGIISWAGVTRKNEKVMRITLDNDKTITCTLDHKFPTWNKGIVEAQNLEVGDSMIPFYSKGDGSYSQIYENESKDWKFVHRLVSDWKEEKGLANGHTAINTIVLHKNLDTHNNNPENIIKLHQVESTKDSTIEVDNLSYRNHKIAKIEFLDVTMDVGTLSIDNEEQYHNHHTFALESGIYTCNSTGELQTDKKFMSMLEDFWLPRREGGRGTEITTLPGGQNLGEITDIKYFQEKLYRSLNVPPTRIGGEGGFNLGRSSEILRDELKFTKFVGRLRKRFSNMFNDMLKTQLILKNIITPEDWKEMREHIQYDFLYDNHFSELKEAELMTERLNMAATAEPYIGKYYSQDYVRRKILRQTDEEIVEQDILIKKEIERGVILDPNAQIDPNTGLPMTGQQQPTQDNIQGASGDVPIDPQSADDKAVEITKDKPL